MNVLGIIGNPVLHSWSPEIFRNFFTAESLTDWDYKIFELSGIYELETLISKYKNLRGLNVTVPFKEKVMEHLDWVHPDARIIGAVNTIKISKLKSNTLLHGYNTDFYGFEKALSETFGVVFKKAMILGTGGSSKAVAGVLNKLKIPYSIVSRKDGYDFKYGELGKSEFKNHDLIINTTPLGMGSSNSDSPPIPYQFLNSNHQCFDLVYTPEQTGFLKQCTPYGAKTCNGLQMLHYQAEKSWEIFKADSNTLDD